MDYRETVSVRLTRAQVERLRQQAHQCGISQSDLIRRWIDGCDAEQELVFADLTLAWLQWLEQAIRSDLHLNRDIAVAFQRLGTGDVQGVLEVVRTLKTSIEAYQRRVTPP
jgi:hypothetical protein